MFKRVFSGVLILAAAAVVSGCQPGAGAYPEGVWQLTLRDEAGSVVYRGLHLAYGEGEFLPEVSAQAQAALAENVGPFGALFVSFPPFGLLIPGTEPAALAEIDPEVDPWGIAFGMQGFVASLISGQSQILSAGGPNLSIYAALEVVSPVRFNIVPIQPSPLFGIFSEDEGFDTGSVISFDGANDFETITLVTGELIKTDFALPPVGDIFEIPDGVLDDIVE